VAHFWAGIRSGYHVESKGARILLYTIKHLAFSFPSTSFHLFSICLSLYLSLSVLPSVVPLEGWWVINSRPMQGNQAQLRVALPLKQTLWSCLQCCPIQFKCLAFLRAKTTGCPNRAAFGGVNVAVCQFKSTLATLTSKLRSLL